MQRQILQKEIRGGGDSLQRHRQDLNSDETRMNANMSSQRISETFFLRDSINFQDSVWKHSRRDSLPIAIYDSRFLYALLLFIDGIHVCRRWLPEFRPASSPEIVT